MKSTVTIKKQNKTKSKKIKYQAFVRMENNWNPSKWSMGLLIGTST